MTLSQSAPNHTEALDAVRAIAAITVFASHGLQIFMMPLFGLDNMFHATNSLLSECAVIVFFILSGYLITLSIFNNKQRNGTFDLRVYARSRLLRIYPPFLISLLICAAIFLAVSGLGLPGSNTPLRLPSDIFATRNQFQLGWNELRPALLLNGGFLDMNGPLWSLYIEAKLYVLAGAVAFALPGATGGPIFALRIVAAAAICLVVIRIGFASSQWVFAWYSLWWLLGAAFFLCRDNRTLAVIAGLGIGAAIVSGSAMNTIGEAIRVLTLLAFAFLIFYHVAHAPRVFVKAAAFSYTLYLIHFPILLFFYSLFVVFEQLGLATNAVRVTAMIVASGCILLLAWSLRWLEDARFLEGLFSHALVGNSLKQQR